MKLLPQVCNILSFLSTNVSEQASVSNFSSPETSKHLFCDAAESERLQRLLINVYRDYSTLQYHTFSICKHLHIYRIIFPKLSKSLCSKIYIAKYTYCQIHIFRSELLYTLVSLRKIHFVCKMPSL